MREVSVEKVKVGDVVAEPVYDDKNQRFLPKGIKLNSALISRLQDRGVSSLFIEGEDPDEVVDNIEELLEELEHRFEGLTGDARMMRIKEIARRHLSPRTDPNVEIVGVDQESAVDEEELETRSDTNEERLRTKVENATNLPSLPDVVIRINEMMDNPSTSGRQVGAEIARDQVLSAKVLKLVNSGLYGFSKPISAISHAVTMLGFDAVKSLVLSSSVLDLMTGVIPGLWEHSQACARTCGLIANHLEMPDPEEITTIGLLHDLGKVVLHMTLEAEYRQVFLRVKKADMLFYKAEEDRRVLGAGINHGTIGGWLLAKWTLPDKLVEPIMYHHNFRPDLEHRERTALVHLADVLCRAEAFGNGGDRKIPRLQPQILETLDMNMDDVEKIMEQMHEGLRDIPRMKPGLDQ
jgi:HD-like signal output (HDOD) protein